LKKFQSKRFLVEMFGNAQGLLSFLRAYDAKLPGSAAVEKWFYREKVPADWMVTLLAYLEIEHGAPVSLRKYLGE
jgi:hypothetical protein